MWNEILNDLWRVYRGRLLGSVFGLFIGAMFLILGFLQTIFLLICISAGFFIGNKIDKKEDLLDKRTRLNMIRRISRELVVQSLFQIDFSGCSAEEALNAAVEEQNSKNALKAQNYAQIALNGILNHFKFAGRN